MERHQHGSTLLKLKRFFHGGPKAEEQIQTTLGTTVATPASRVNSQNGRAPVPALETNQALVLHAASIVGPDQGLAICEKPDVRLWEEAWKEASSADTSHELLPFRAVHAVSDNPAQAFSDHLASHLKQSTRRPHELLRKTKDYTDIFIKAGDLAVAQDPTQYSSVPWIALKMIYQASLENLAIRDAMADGLERATYYISWARIEEILNVGGAHLAADQIGEALKALYKSILVFLGKCNKYLSERHLTHFIKAIIALRTSAEFTDMSTQFEDLRRKIQASSAQIMRQEQTTQGQRIVELSKQLENVSTDIKYIKDSQEAAEYASTLNWIYNTKTQDVTAELIDRCTEGTGAWLLKRPETQNFFYSLQSSMIWLHGEMGHGKTMLMTLLLVHWRRHVQVSFSDWYPNYFYFRRTLKGSSNSPISCLRSILRQLIRHAPDSEVAEDIKTRRSNAVTCTFSPTETVELMVSQINARGVTLIFIDALDECEDPDAMIDYLLKIRDCCKSPLKIFVTSRNDPNFDWWLQQEDVVQVTLSAEMSSQDIARHIEVKSPAVLRKLERALRAPQGWAEDNLASVQYYLSTNANGMFLWVDLQLEYLSRIRDMDHFNDRLKTAPPKLLDLYEDLYKQRVSQFEIEEELTMFRRILEWLLTSQDPLSPPIINDLAKADMKSREQSEAQKTATVLRYVHGFAAHDEEIGSLCFAHASALEFFKSKGHELEPSVHAAEGHARATVACIQLLQRHYESSCNAEIAGWPDSGKQFDDKRWIHHANASSYASQFWNHHAHLAESTGYTSSDYIEKLQSFLQIGNAAYQGWIKTTQLRSAALSEPVEIHSCSCGELANCNMSVLTVMCVSGLHLSLEQTIRAEATPLQMDRAHHVWFDYGLRCFSPMALAAALGHMNIVKLFAHHNWDPRTGFPRSSRLDCGANESDIWLPGPAAAYYGQFGIAEYICKYEQSLYRGVEYTQYETVLAFLITRPGSNDACNLILDILELHGFQDASKLLLDACRSRALDKVSIVSRLVHIVADPKVFWKNPLVRFKSRPSVEEDCQPPPTPLSEALQTYNDEVVELLIKERFYAYLDLELARYVPFQWDFPTFGIQAEALARLIPHAERSDLSQALNKACFTGNFDLVSDLLDLGADPNLLDRWGDFALYEALDAFNSTFAEPGPSQIRICQLLLDRGASLTTYGVRGSLLNWAITTDSPEPIIWLARILSERAGHQSSFTNGVVMNIEDGAKLALVEQLLDCGLEIDHCSPNAKTPLELASDQGQVEIVQVFLGRSRSAESTMNENSMAESSLSTLSIIPKHVRELFSSNGSRSGKDNATLISLCRSLGRFHASDGKSSYMTGAKDTDEMKATQILKAHKSMDITDAGACLSAIFTTLNEDSDAPDIHYLADRQCRPHAARMIRLLLLQGADPNTLVNGLYGNCFQAAVAAYPVDTVRQLLGHGANVNIQGGYFGHPLRCALQYGYEDTIALLISHGAVLDDNHPSYKSCAPFVYDYDAEREVTPKTLSIEQEREMRSTQAVTATSAG